jgi:hypothetical protein
MFNIQELTEITQKAIEEGERKAKAIAAEKLAKESAKRKLVLAKAEHVIEQIPSRAKREATAGRNHAIVMALNNDDWKEASYSNSKPTNLIGVGKLVWEYCVEAKLNPTLEHWHDGVGINGGYNLVIHWPKKKD